MVNKNVLIIHVEEQGTCYITYWVLSEPPLVLFWKMLDERLVSVVGGLIGNDESRDVSASTLIFCHCFGRMLWPISCRDRWMVVVAVSTRMNPYLSSEVDIV